MRSWRVSVVILADTLRAIGVHKLNKLLEQIICYRAFIGIKDNNGPMVGINLVKVLILA